MGWLGRNSSLVVTLTFFTFSLWSFVRLFWSFWDSWESWSTLEIVMRRTHVLWRLWRTTTYVRWFLTIVWTWWCQILAMWALVTWRVKPKIDLKQEKVKCVKDKEFFAILKLWGWCVRRRLSSCTNCTLILRWVCVRTGVRGACLTCWCMTGRRVI